MKMLLAASILTLALAGVAVAGDADWTFYGVAHASINSLSDGTYHQLGLTSNTSRFGLKGTSQINNDFTAFWQVESKLDLAGNSGSDGTMVGTRNTFVGVQNESAGKFIVGRHDTPFKALGRKVEMFPDQLGDFRSLTMGWDERRGEIAAWVSPDWDGFSVFAAYQFDLNSPSATYEATSFSAMGTYTSEHLMVGAAYQGFSRGYGDYYGAGGPTAKRLVAKYTAKQFELAGLYQATYEDQNRSLYGLSGNYHVNGQWNLKGAMFIYNDDTDARDQENYPGDTALDEGDTRATMTVVGVERVFSDNVLVYAQAASVNNHDGLLDSESNDVSLGGNDSGFGTSVSGTWDSGWQDPAGFSVGTVISW